MLSQEVEQQKDRLAAEESRLEMAMLETRMLQQSLLDQVSMLENFFFIG
jgi:hypothetical protein